MMTRGSATSNCDLDIHGRRGVLRCASRPRGRTISAAVALTLATLLLQTRGDASACALINRQDGDAETSTCGDCHPGYRAGRDGGVCRHAPDPLPVAFYPSTHGRDPLEQVYASRSGTPCGLVFADLDGDGLQDAIIGPSSAGEPVRMYRRSSLDQELDGQGIEIEGLSDDDQACDSLMQFADVDGDDDLDCIVISWTSELRYKYFRNDGNATRPQFVYVAADPFRGALKSAIDPRCYNGTTAYGLACIGSLSLVDIDGDSDLDLFALSSSYETPLFYRNQGSQASPDYVLVEGPGNPLRGIAYAATLYLLPALGFFDVDDDGDLDAYMITDRAKGPVFFLNSGNATVAKFKEVADEVDPFTSLKGKIVYALYPAVGLRGSGLVDFYVDEASAVNDYSWLPAAPSLGTNAYTASPDAAFVRSIATIGTRYYKRSRFSFADLDDDGNRDAIVTSHFVSKLQTGEDASDGIDQIVFMRNTGNLSEPKLVLETTAALDQITAAGLQSINGIEFADLDLDGILDAVVAHEAGLTTFWNTAPRGNLPALTMAAAQADPMAALSLSAPVILAFGDLDDDARSDVLIVDAQGLVVGRNRNGTFIFANITADVSFDGLVEAGLSTSSGLEKADFVDLDLDGDLDLVLTGAGGASLFISRNDGNSSHASFQAPTEVSNLLNKTAPRSYEWLQTTFADMDGDGDLDGFSLSESLISSRPVVMVYARNTARECASSCSGRGFCAQPASSLASSLADDEKALLGVDSAVVTTIDALVGRCVCESESFRGVVCEFCARDDVFGRNCDQPCPAFSRVRAELPFPMASALEDCQCPAGFVRVPFEAGFACHCPAGSHINVDAQRCDPCPIGTYSDQVDDSTTCHTCEPREASTLAVGSTSEAACVCAADRVNTGSECVCASNSYESLGECEPCPLDFPLTASHGAVSIEECVAAPGTFELDGELATCSFTSGLNCSTSGLTLATTPLLPGYWRASELTSAVLACPEPSFCKGGAYGDYCAVHHEGVLCASCEIGYAMKKGSCTACTKARTQRDGGVAGIVLVTASILALAPAALLSWKSWRQHRARGAELPRSISRKSSSNGIRNEVFRQRLAGEFWAGMGVKTRTLAAFLQIQAFFAATRYAGHASKVWSALIGADVGGLLAVLELGCAMSTSFYTRLVITTAFPLIAIGGAFAVAGVLHSRKAQGRGELEALSYATWMGFQILIWVFIAVTSTLIASLLPEDFAAGSSSNNSGANVTTTSMSETTLWADYSVDFDAASSRRGRQYAGVMLMVFLTGTLVACWLGSWCSVREGPPMARDPHAQDSVASARLAFLRGARFLVKPYRREIFWFETFELLRRFSLTSGLLLVMYASSSSISSEPASFFFTAMSVLVAVATNILSPYLETSDAVFAQASGWLLVIVGLIAWGQDIGVFSSAAATGLMALTGLSEVAAFIVALRLPQTSIEVRSSRRSSSADSASTSRADTGSAFGLRDADEEKLEY